MCKGTFITKDGIDFGMYSMLEYETLGKYIAAHCIDYKHYIISTLLLFS